MANSNISAVRVILIIYQTYSKSFEQVVFLYKIIVKKNECIMTTEKKKNYASIFNFPCFDWSACSAMINIALYFKSIFRHYMPLFITYSQPCVIVNVYLYYVTTTKKPLTVFI
jgi:hypothetical protein